MLSKQLKQTALSLLALSAFTSGIVIAASDDNPFLRGSAATLTGGVTDENSKAVMIVLDVSGSMAEPAPGAPTKILMAKQVLEQVLSKIDSSIPVGLRVYGSSKPSYDPVVACQDSVLLVPIGTGNRGQMISKLRELKPSGATPISYSLRQAVQDLQRVEVANKNIVLISDGMESCGSDPCALAQSFKAAGVKMQFNVVGFNVDSDYATRAQLECIAKSTGGKYYSATTSAELAEGVLDGMNNFKPSINTVTGQLKEVGDKAKNTNTSPLRSNQETKKSR